MYYLISLEVKVKAETLIACYKIGEPYTILNNKYGNGSEIDVSTWAGLRNDMQDRSRNHAANNYERRDLGL